MTVDERNELIVNHMPYAAAIAANQFKKFPHCVQLDEVQSAAYAGLCDAAIKYDGQVVFTTYAFTRICGEIKDYLRSLSWGGRSQAFSMSTLDFDYAAEVENSDLFDDLTSKLSPLAQKLLRMYFIDNLTMKEIAERIGFSQAKVCKLINKSILFLRENYECG